MVRPILSMIVGISVGSLCACLALAEDIPAEQLEFFEKKIRPVLVQHCYKCHSQQASEKDELRGGLLLDSRAGILAGGESGVVLLPGKPDRGTLLEALNYDTFEMPPDGKLPAEIIADFRTWIEMGAADPRDGVLAENTELDIEKGRQFWAYQPIAELQVPGVRESETAIDAFILKRLADARLTQVRQAERHVLIRRLYYDLTGLPPSIQQIDRFVNDSSVFAYENLVDQLLASPRFGERWGRRWLDIVRYAESVTLRGLLYKEAWRYRDYVISSFNQETPFDEFIQQQIAGDLLPWNTLEQRQRNLIATGYLAMGNNNLEDQDKSKLRMDAVDEQLETMSRGLLGQTVGCARCHDHKFDPIPTRDYYALAGILRSTKSIEDANVSRWLELELPISPAAEREYKQHSERLAVIKSELTGLKKTTPAGTVALNDLPGIVVDEVNATRTGTWKNSTSVKSYVGPGYQFSSGGTADTTAVFEPPEELEGEYEVRFAYTPGSNRPAVLNVEVWTADGSRLVTINEQTVPEIAGHFDSLGIYTFSKGSKPRVVVDASKAKGAVVIDAVQFLSKEALIKVETEHPQDKESVVARIKELEAEQKVVQALLPVRMKYMSVVEAAEIEDTQVHIRGDVHNLGEDVPRGFLRVAAPSSPITFSQGESGRRELGQWLTDSGNPLTARVFANRVWHWLLGAGIVRTTDNFGSTGELPSHAELLDYLAGRLIESGWSVKELVREVVLSNTYRASSWSTDELSQADPENRLLGRMNRRRMDAEAILDAMLTVTGQLDLVMGGPTMKTGTNNDYGYEHEGFRRAVYWPVLRNSLPAPFQVFDFANPSVVVGRRNVSSTSPQALYMMNNPVVMEYSGLAAKQFLAAELPGDSARFEVIVRTILGRSPTAGESRVALQFVANAAESDATEEIWARVIQTVFASVDFRYID